MNRRTLIILSTIFLIIFVYASGFRALVRPVVDLPDVPGGVQTQTLLLLLFSLTHAIYALGWRHTAIFFAITAVVSWAFEQVGVETGAVYGAYYYTDFLGPKLGHVPVLIPLAWFMMIYPSYIIVNLIVQGRPTGTPSALKRVLWLAFFSGVVMTAWDLVVDPFLTSPPFEAWVWTEGGPYFGIPVQNYIGWLLTTFTVYLLYRLYESRVALRPMGPLNTALIIMPLVAYGSLMIANSFSMAPQALHVIGPFVMGIPLLAAASQLMRPQTGAEG